MFSNCSYAQTLLLRINVNTRNCMYDRGDYTHAQQPPKTSDSIKE